MTTRRRSLPLAASAAAVLALALAGCGGGNGEPPPQPATATVTAAAPVVTITNDVTAETATGPITFTFSFSRDVGTTFTADDVTVTDGTAGAFTRLSGTSAKLVVTPTPNATGIVKVSVAAGRVTDAVGTGNAETSAQKAFNTVLPDAQTTLVSFEENPAPALIGFGGAEDSTVVVDPTDTTNKVARIVKSATAELWAGTTVAVCPNDAIARLPFSSSLTTLSARVWSPVAGIPVRLKVENAADSTQSVETEATVTVASGWQTIKFNFANPVSGTAALNPTLTYNKASVFFNFGTPGAATGERTYYLDDLAFVGSTFTASCTGTGGGASTATITMDESPAPTLAGFGGAEDASVAADPVNAANKVARVVKSATAELWAGVTVSTLANNTIPRIAFSAGNTTVTVRVWSPDAGIPVRLKVENAADATKSVETEATVTTAAGWQVLSFNFANQVSGTPALDLAGTYDRISIFFNFGKTGAQAGGAKIYFFEDVTVPAPGGSGGGGGGAGASSATISFDEATPPTLAGFGGAEDASVVVDPTNAANKVARVVKSATAELWAGVTASTLPNNTIPRIAFSAGNTTVTVRVWSPDAGIPVRLKVENAADATKSVETEATVTTAAGWQVLSFNFANQASGTPALDLAGTYDRISIFFNFGKTGAQAGGAKTYYFEDITFPASSGSGSGGGGGATANSATISFDEATAPTLAGFGGSEDASVVADPTNAANKVARVVKSAAAELWAGVTVSTLPGNTIGKIAFSASRTTLTVRVWSPDAGIPVRLKVEDAADGSKSVETEATVTTAAGWQLLSFDFSKPATGTAALNLATNYNRVSIFFNFGRTGAQAGGAKTYYLDDLSYPVDSGSGT